MGVTLAFDEAKVLKHTKQFSILEVQPSTKMTKKKTVKELTEDVKSFEERLAVFENYKAVFDKLSDVNLKELETKVKIINNASNDSKFEMLERKLEENSVCMKTLQNKLEETVANVDNNLQSKIDDKVDNGRKIAYDCKKCDETFTEKSKLKSHIKTKHPKVIRCHVCDMIFEKTYQLELHLKSHDVEDFKCKVCEKVFRLRWRLEKHEAAHTLNNVKFCHYFNNGKKCPYEDIGCMFNHKVSDNCRYNQFCRNRLCQFRHDNEQNKHSEDENDLDKESNNDSDCEAESESEAIECDLCGSLFEKEYELTEHQETGNCGYLCEPCGVSFL